MKPRVSDLVIAKFVQVADLIMLSKMDLLLTKNNSLFVNSVK